MTGTDKYETLYREGRGVCGEPFAEIAGFFESYGAQRAGVLDLGCGQGRDALLAVRHGHRVLGVDSSPTGIRQMLEDAEAEGLTIEGVVADLREYEIEANYDVVLLDRVLHMLDGVARTALLERALQHVSMDGFLLIADLPRHKTAFRRIFTTDPRLWSSVHDLRGFLFRHRVG